MMYIDKEVIAIILDNLVSNACLLYTSGATVKMAGGGFRKVLPDAHEDVRCFYEDDKQQM